VGELPDRDRLLVIDNPKACGVRLRPANHVVPQLSGLEPVLRQVVLALRFSGAGDPSAAPERRVGNPLIAVDEYSPLANDLCYEIIRLRRPIHSRRCNVNEWVGGV